MRILIFTLCVVVFVGVVEVGAQQATWLSRGPGGGGALFLPSFNPNTPGDISVACDMSQEFRTGNYGAQWNQIHFTQLQTNNHHGKLCFTSDTNIIYTIDVTSIGGSEAYRPTKSTDGGKTWKVVAVDPTAGGAGYLVASFPNPNIVIVADYKNIYRSSNGGLDWENIYSTSSSSGIHVAGSLFVGNGVFIGLSNGVLHSTDGAKTFSFFGANNGIDTTANAIFSFAGAVQGGVHRFFATVHSKGDVYGGVTALDKPAFQGIYSMDWATKSWSKKNMTGSTTIPYFVGMAENNINVCYAAGGSALNVPTVLVTSDAGATWKETFKTTGNQNIYTGWSGAGGDRQWTYGEFALGFAVNPSNVNEAVFTDYGFVHITRSTGNEWQQLYVAPTTQNAAGTNTPKGRSYSSVGLENTTAWHVVWLDSLNMYACFSDIQGCRSTDGGETWSFNYTGHTDNSLYHVVRHPTTHVTYGATSTVHDMYQSTYLQDARIDNGKGKVIYSKDEGATWNVLHDFAHPVIWLALDPTNTERLYASVIHSTQGGVYVTDNLGGGPATSWTKLPNPPRTSGHPFCLRVLKDGTLLVTYSGRRDAAGKFTPSSGVFLWNGTAWSDVSDPGMQYWTKDVVVDAADLTESTWYVGVFSGWGGAPNGKGGLYRTTNKGATWRKINNLDRVTSVTFTPNKNNEAYITTETDGMWVSANIRDENPTFALVQSYPFRQPERVYFSPYKPQEMWVTSFGNGMKKSGGEPTQDRPNTITLVAPLNNQSEVSIPIKFIWNSDSLATSYDVTVTFHGMSDVYSTMNVQADTTLLVNAPTCTNYSWYVKGRSLSGSGPASDTWKGNTLCPTSTDEELLPNHKAPYPNPTSDVSYLDLATNAHESVVIDVFDNVGRIVLNTVVEIQGSQSVELDLRILPTGVYIGVVKSLSGDSVRTFRIVKW